MIDHPVDRGYIIGVIIGVTILRNQSEVGSIDCKIQPEKGINFFCFLLFENLLNCS